MLKESPIILLIDAELISNILIHSPHYIIISKIENAKVTIYDPWNGEKIIVEIKDFLKSFNSLKNRLYYSPILIRIK